MENNGNSLVTSKKMVGNIYDKLNTVPEKTGNMINDKLQKVLEQNNDFKIIQQINQQKYHNG